MCLPYVIISGVVSALAGEKVHTPASEEHLDLCDKKVYECSRSTLPQSQSVPVLARRKIGSTGNSAGQDGIMEQFRKRVLLTVMSHARAIDYRTGTLYGYLGRVVGYVLRTVGGGGGSVSLFLYVSEWESPMLTLITQGNTQYKMISI